MPHEVAVKIIIDGKGVHFDPDMVDAFIELQEDFKHIAATYADSDKDMDKKAEYIEQAMPSK